jgi:murein DD-endopeptidase MepM/ murein hydrolase activator NlpD
VSQRVRLICLAVAAGLAVACGSSAAEPPAGTGPVWHHDVGLPRDSETVTARVPRNATLETVLKAEHLSTDLVFSLITAVRRVFDPRRLRANQSYHLTRALDGAFREFRYDIDLGSYLRVAPHDRGVGLLDAEVVTYPREVSLDAVSTEITRARPSLIEALAGTGQNVQLALIVADIFGGEVDFNSDLQPGDRLDVLFERVRQNGDLVGYGNVPAVVFTNNGHQLTAIGHTGVDGRRSWYDENGQSLKRQFLRSPLRLENNPRVTSRFSYRRQNPVSGDIRAHLGVDYQANYGEPIVAVAAGTVESADWAGEAGRMILLRHAGGYETAYLHLSDFAPGIHGGARVEQGQLLGRVGQSGSATGPHLDYRVKKNGVYVNPLLALDNMPKGDPVPKEAMEAFVRERDTALGALKRVSAAPPSTSPVR